MLLEEAVERFLVLGALEALLKVAVEVALTQLLLSLEGLILAELQLGLDTFFFEHLLVLVLL